MKTSCYVIVAYALGADHAAAKHLLDTDFAGAPFTYQPDNKPVVQVAASKKSAELDLEACMSSWDECVTDGLSRIWRYDLDDATVLIYNNPHVPEIIIAGPKATAYDFLCTFDTGHLELSQHLAQWGYSHPQDLWLQLAGPADTNVRVWARYHYYKSIRCRGRDGYLVDPYDPPRVLTLSTYAAAQAWVEKQYREPGVLRNGEAASPTYYIVK